MQFLWLCQQELHSGDFGCVAEVPVFHHGHCGNHRLPTEGWSGQHQLNRVALIRRWFVDLEGCRTYIFPYFSCVSMRGPDFVVWKDGNLDQPLWLDHSMPPWCFTRQKAGVLRATRSLASGTSRDLGSPKKGSWGREMEPLIWNGNGTNYFKSKVGEIV